MFKPITLNILALLILCAAGFVFFKNKKAYELEIENRIQQQAYLAESKKRLQKAIDEYNATVAEDKREQDLIAELLVEEEEQKEIKSGLERELRDREDELRFFQNNPDMVNEWRDKVRIAENSMDEIKVLDKEIKELNTMVSNRETNLDNLTNKNNGLMEDIANLKAHILSRSDGRSIEGLVTKIRAVYNSWGFVTLSDGDKTGVVLNSTLDVVRDDEVIAKLLVTIVEQDSASANIVPGSMAPDTFLMIGDSVVPAKLSSPNGAGEGADAPEGPADEDPGDAPVNDAPAGILDLIQ
jgi:DNA repair exonuclease SbcCD ATPase subunit